MRLEGRTALVTGGGAGIGRAIAQVFASEGANVCITGRRPATLDAVAENLPSDRVSTSPGDVTRTEDAARMVEAALRFTGKLDILVNNAAIDPAGTVVDLELDVWNRVIQTNLTGPFLMMKHAIPHMIEAHGGSIINIASLAGIRCLPGMPAYCSSKAALIMLSKQVALDYGYANIRCNVVCPGATRTAMLENSLAPAAKAMGTEVDEVFAAMSSNTPLRRVSSPEEIARTCLCLAGDDMTFVTGAEIVADGGAHIVDVTGTTLTSVGIKWGGP
ncbi:MAG: SDR family oxidoreductase [Armatimonadetes bacterium]|nr:SDR family oxidoreductase [Armatimonadota bacterium]